MISIQVVIPAGSPIAPACARGSFFSLINIRCLPCAAGSYSAVNNAVTCLLAPPGTYANAGARNGSTGYLPCPGGYYSAGSGSTSCLISPYLSYSNRKVLNLLSPSGLSSMRAIYACFLARALYYGPIFEIRRSSDNSITNIYSDALGNLGMYMYVACPTRSHFF